LPNKNAATKSGGYAILAFGVLVCLIGALLLFDGSILGERTIGIAILVLVVGLGIIVQANERIELTF
jgi:hypothetical protein